MKPIYYTLLLFAAALTFQSCIKRGEDNDCIRGVQIYFSTDFSVAQSTRAVNVEQIKQIDLFAFDAATKLYVAHESVTDVVLTDNFYITLPIGTGEYRFIAWANVDDCFYHSLELQTIMGKTYEELFVNMKYDASGVVETNPHMLFFGDIKNQQVVTSEAQRFKIKMFNNTYTITLKTKGLPISSDTYKLSITDRNGHLNYENNIAPIASDAITYNALCTPDEDQMPTTSLNVLKLVEGRNVPKIIFTNTAQTEELFNADLMPIIEQMLAKVPGATLDNTHEFEIELEFDGIVLLEVNVNGWRVKIEQNEEII